MRNWLGKYFDLSKIGIKPREKKQEQEEDLGFHEILKLPKIIDPDPKVVISPDAMKRRAYQTTPKYCSVCGKEMHYNEPATYDTHTGAEIRGRYIFADCPEEPRSDQGRFKYPLLNKHNHAQYIEGSWRAIDTTSEW